MTDTTIVTEADAIQALLERDDDDTPTETETPDPAEQEDLEVEEETTEDAEVDEDPAPEEEQEEPEAPEEPTTFTVRVDGEERRVTLEELTRNYSGQASIQRRIQDAETQRKQAAAAADAFAREYQGLQVLAQQVQTTGLVPPPSPPDPAIAQSNPAAYVKAIAEYQSKAAAYQQQQQQIQHAQTTAARLEEARRSAFVSEQRQRLAEMVPDFAQPETAAKATERLLQAGQSFGFSAEELSGVVDARMVAVLHKAAQYDALQARQKEARKTAPTPTPRHVAPARNQTPMSDETKALLSFRKTRSEKDAVRLLMARGS